MAAAAPFHRKGAAEKPTPWSSETLWDGPGKNVRLWEPGFHDDCLFALVNPAEKRGMFELWCYQKGKGRGARRIPLKFQMDAAAAATLPLLPGHMPDAWSIDEIEHPDTCVVPIKMITTEQGLCFQFISAGFWFLPYADIAAYLNTAPD